MARPTGDGPFPSLVLIHHAPGWDEFYFEFAHRFANHGFIAMAPNYYARYGHGTPDDVAALARGDGGPSDDQVLADSEAAARWLRSLPSSNGNVGILGTCSGGRHSLMVASRSKSFQAIVDLWGGSVVATRRLRQRTSPPESIVDLWGGGVVATPTQLTAKRPVPVIDYTKDLNTPLLGIFGNDDMNPSPAQVNQHEAELRRLGKQYEFLRYDGAGHGFFYYHAPAYRQAQAMDAWNKMFPFLEQKLR